MPFPALFSVTPFVNISGKTQARRLVQQKKESMSTPKQREGRFNIGGAMGPQPVDIRATDF